MVLYHYTTTQPCNNQTTILFVESNNCRMFATLIWSPAAPSQIHVRDLLGRHAAFFAAVGFPCPFESGLVGAAEDEVIVFAVDAQGPGAHVEAAFVDFGGLQ